MESEIKQIKIEDFGHDGLSIARVIAEYKGIYKVKNSSGEYLAKITGKQMFNALSREDYPAVGDWVEIKGLDKERAVICGILPRKTIIRKKFSNKNEVQIIASNIDVAFIIESVDRDYNLNRFERYFAIAKDGGIKPTIILNKVDLISREELCIKLAEIKNRFNGVDVFSTSVKNNTGLEELEGYIQSGQTYCFLGSSGVGKSSIINELLGKNILKTETISLHTGKGRHTTTNREMYFLKNGGIVIDNPGMREVGMADSGAGISDVFDEITVLADKCRYADCTHVHEPGCGVLASVKSGKLDEEKYLNYVNLKKETEYYEANKTERREKERKFGKFVKTIKKELKKFKDY